MRRSLKQSTGKMFFQHALYIFCGLNLFLRCISFSLSTPLLYLSLSLPLDQRHAQTGQGKRSLAAAPAPPPHSRPLLISFIVLLHFPSFVFFLFSVMTFVQLLLFCNYYYFRFVSNFQKKMLFQKTPLTPGFNPVYTPALDYLYLSLMGQDFLDKLQLTLLGCTFCLSQKSCQLQRIQYEN